MVNRSVHPSICPSDRALKAHRTPVHFCLCLSATLCLKSLCYSVKTFLFPHSHDLSSSGNLGARLLRFGSYCTISRTVLSFPSLRPSPPSPRVGLELAVVRITSNVRCSTTFNISCKVTAADYIAETTARIGSAGRYGFALHFSLSLPSTLLIYIPLYVFPFVVCWRGQIFCSPFFFIHAFPRNCALSETSVETFFSISIFSFSRVFFLPLITRRFFLSSDPCLFSVRFSIHSPYPQNLFLPFFTSVPE